MSRQPFAAGLRWAVLLSALFGTVTRLAVSLPAEFGRQTLLYFTVQSNLMVCIFLVTDTFVLGSPAEPGVRGSRRWQAVHGAVLLYITITGLVYNTILAWGFDGTGLNRVVVQVNHTVTPLLFIADWVFRQDRYRYSGKLVLPWLAYPVAYLICASIEGAATGRFRYPFLDFLHQRIGFYILGMIVVTLFFVGFSQLYIFINRRTVTRRTRAAGGGTCS